MVFYDIVHTFERSKPDVMRLRIEEIMAEKGLRKAEVARKAGLVQTNLNKAINENGNPTIETLERIANALEVEVYELFTDELPTEPEGLVLLGGQTYSLFKAPTASKVPVYPSGIILFAVVTEFVRESVQRRKTASFGGIVNGSGIFTIIYDPDGGEAERFLLSVTSGENTFTETYLMDEYQQSDKDGSYITWQQDLITKELCAAIESGGRAGMQFNNLVAD